MNSVVLGYIMVLHIAAFARWKSNATLFISVGKESISASYRNIVLIILNNGILVIRNCYLYKKLHGLIFLSNYVFPPLFLKLYLFIIEYLQIPEKHENDNILNVTRSQIF